MKEELKELKMVVVAKFSYVSYDLDLLEVMKV